MQHNQVRTIVYVKHFKIKNIEPGAITFTTETLAEFAKLLNPPSRSPSPTEDRAEELEIERKMQEQHSTKPIKPHVNIRKWVQQNYKRSKNTNHEQKPNQTQENTPDTPTINTLPRANLAKWNQPDFPLTDIDRNETKQ